MARISGVNIPSNKRVVVALTYIYGIGSTIAKEICKKTNIENSKRVNDLNDNDETLIIQKIEILILDNFIDKFVNSIIQEVIHEFD